MFIVDFADAGRATAVTVRDHRGLPGDLASIGLVPPRPTVVVVGGAGGLQAADAERLRHLFAAALVPVLADCAAVCVDGGTHAGAMRLLGQARVAANADFPLVGVVAAGTVRLPGDQAARAGAAELDPHHSHVVVVPGQDWGAEAPWISRVATVLAGEGPSLTILVNGGDIAYSDVRHSLDADRPVLTVADTGRTADELAAAVHGKAADDRAVALVASGLVRSVPAGDTSTLAAIVAGTLKGRRVRRPDHEDSDLTAS